MDIRINNTNTKFVVWVNIYLADFFWNFQIFQSKKTTFCSTSKTGNEGLWHWKSGSCIV